MGPTPSSSFIQNILLFARFSKGLGKKNTTYTFLYLRKLGINEWRVWLLYWFWQQEILTNSERQRKFPWILPKKALKKISKRILKATITYARSDVGIVVSIAAFQAVDPGSIPGHRRDFFCPRNSFPFWFISIHVCFGSLVSPWGKASQKNEAGHSSVAHVSPSVWLGWWILSRLWASADTESWIWNFWIKGFVFWWSDQEILSASILGHNLLK